MYSFLPQQIQSKVSKNFEYANEKELEQYLKVLVLYCNVCAHNECLFSHKVYSEIPDTLLHKKIRYTKEWESVCIREKGFVLGNYSIKVFIAQRRLSSI